ncbi:MAG: GC-type dockerin domain-anchored protein [Phycisphaerales bacterium]
MNSFTRISVLLGVMGGVAASLAQPDAKVSAISSIARFGPVENTYGYSIAYSVCNDTPTTDTLAYIASQPRHPIIGWSVYRLHDGRLDQIGISWLHHTFAALQTHCTTCTATGSSVNALFPGCASPESSGIAAQGSQLGPRFEVNPATGAFAYPFSSPAGVTGNAIHKLCQIHENDLIPGALYFLETQIVHPDESPDTRTNNRSYRRITLGPSASLLPTGPTVVGSSALDAWRDHALGIDTPDPSIAITTISIPNDGRVSLAASATETSPGTYQYDYVIENLDCTRAIRAVTIPATDASMPEFHDINYHSGEPFDSTDWSLSTPSAAIAWSAETFAQNPNANALRWGTAYRFSFTTSRAPVAGAIALDLFTPGSPDRVAINAPIPAPLCPADLDDGSGLGLPDAGVTIDDLLYYIILFNTGNIRADLDDGTSTGTPDAGVTIDDLLYYLTRFNARC